MIIEFAISASAATRSVGVGCTYPSIPTALAAAADGDVIAVRTGTKFVHSVVVTKDLTFQTANAFCVVQKGVGTVTLDGSGLGRIFDIQGASVTIDGFDLRNGDTGAEDGALVRLDSGVLTVIGGTWSGGTTEGRGGAIYANASTIDISGDAVFADNFANHGGGAIQADATEVWIGPATFAGNHTEDGHGGAVAVIDADLTIVADTGVTVFTANVSFTDGGAIHSTGGKVFTSSGAVLFDHNSSGYHGGAICADELILEGGLESFVANEAVVGGAIFVAGPLTCDGGTFLDNYAWGSGGAIAGTGQVAVWDSTFDGNIAVVDGGAVHRIGAGTYLTFYRNTVTANQASTGRGGAVFSEGAHLAYVVDSTFTGNSALEGGAIYLVSTVATYPLYDATVRLVNDHLIDNDADVGGAVVLEANDWAEIGLEVGDGCSPTVAPCSELRGNTGSALVLLDQGATIRQTVFSANEVATGTLTGSALDLDPTSSVLVYDSLFFDNSKVETKPAAWAHAAGGVGAGLYVYSSTLANNGGPAIRWGPDTSGRFEQSIDQLNGSPMIAGVGSSVSMACSNRVPIVGTATSVIDCQNNVVGLFVGAANDDYRLAVGSPSLDRCAPLAYTDHRPDLFALPADGSYDQGAYELQ